MKAQESDTHWLRLQEGTSRTLTKTFSAHLWGTVSREGKARGHFLRFFDGLVGTVPAVDGIPMRPGNTAGNTDPAQTSFMNWR